MKQKLITGILILITISLISVVVIGSKQKNSPSVTSNPEIETITPSPVVLDANVFYWGEACPHCHDTIDWMEENKINEKVKVIRKEIYENKDNAKELIQNAKLCGINEKEIGVPFMYTKSQKCLIGTPDITSYLQEEINKLETNNEVTN